MAGKGLIRRSIWSLAQPALVLTGVAAPGLVAEPALAQTATEPVATGPSYVELARLIDRAEMVLRAKIQRQSEVSVERAPGLRSGWVRLYIEAEPTALLAGKAPLAETLRYLVDLPLDERGRPPRLKKTSAILFARAVAGRPGELQLVGRGAQLAADTTLEARLRPILAEFFAADAPPRIVGIRDVLWVPGNLAGESETQLFLRTASEVPALISVIRRPGMEPSWGVSWGELADQSGRPPTPETIAWYRLACFLPPRLPAAAQLSADPLAREQAERDYALVRRDLGRCMLTAE